MKNVLLLTLEYPPQVGGIAEYLRNLFDRLPPGAVSVLTQPHEDGHQFDMGKEYPIYRRALTTSFLRPRWLPMLFQMERACKGAKPDVVVISHILPAGIAALRQKRRHGTPYIAIVHGMDVALAAHAGGRKRKQAEEILQEASLVIANSRYTAAFSENFGVPKDRIMIINPSPSFPLSTMVHPEEVGKLRQQWHVDGEPVVLSVGRLVKRKGFDDVIHAIAELKRNDVLVHYVVVGDGPERKMLEDLSYELSVEDRVIFTGAVPTRELPLQYAACDVFVSPSKSIGPDIEGFGTVYLEANLMGKPVIAGRTGGVPDAVLGGTTGLLVEPGDVRAIAESIKILLTDKVLADKLGAQGRERVINEFGWDRQAERFKMALESIESGT